MNRHRFSIFSAKAVFDSRIGDSELRVLAAIGTYTDEDGWCFPHQETIAGRIGRSRSVVSRAVGRLVACGYVETENRVRRGRGRVGLRYRVVIDLEPDMAAAVKHFADVRGPNTGTGATDVQSSDVRETGAPMFTGSAHPIEDQPQDHSQAKKRVRFDGWEPSAEDLAHAAGLDASEVHAIAARHRAWVSANLPGETRTPAGWSLLFRAQLDRHSASPRAPVRAEASFAVLLPAEPAWWAALASELTAHNPAEYASWWAPCVPVAEGVLQAASGLAAERCTRLAAQTGHPAAGVTIQQPPSRRWGA
ncbi:MAG: helix-turn-helix domain-containing protein [Patescibacteria group bacterium]|nr:helix-turn-helix domain-containing protein [Patescibacteria group bacterium]